MKRVSSIFLYFFIIVMILIIGAAVGVILTKADPRNDDLLPLNPDFKSRQVSGKINKSIIDTKTVDEALAFNKKSNDVKIIGWTVDGKYKIYNLARTVEHNVVLIGDKEVNAKNLDKYKISPILIDDFNSSQYKCDILCIDEYGSYIGVPPKQ